MKRVNVLLVLTVTTIIIDYHDIVICRKFAMAKTVLAILLCPALIHR